MSSTIFLVRVQNFLNIIFVNLFNPTFNCELHSFFLTTFIICIRARESTIFT